MQSTRNSTRREVGPQRRTRRLRWTRSAREDVVRASTSPAGVPAACRGPRSWRRADGRCDRERPEHKITDPTPSVSGPRGQPQDSTGGSSLPLSRSKRREVRTAQTAPGDSEVWAVLVLVTRRRELGG
jgi:hypothetical protein